MKPIALAATAAALAAPLAAQAPSVQTATAEEPRVVQMVVYGDDPCPPSTGDVIIVCARRGDNERYRIPEIVRDPDTGAEAWAVRAETLEMASDTGIQSCSTVGPGGFTGCWAEMMRQARRGATVGPAGQKVP